MNEFSRVLILGFSEDDLEKKEWLRLKKISKKIILLPKNSPNFINHLGEADCFLININQGVNIDKKTIDSALNLKYIGICATGYGCIDAVYAALKGITVCNVPGYATEAVAEFVFAVLLDNLREIERAKKQARSGVYSESTFNGIEIKDKVFGVIGLGKIGMRVAEIALQGFKSKVIYWSRKRKKKAEKAGILYESVSDILKKSDIISINLTYNNKTLKFFGKKEISYIKPGAIVINTAPMELIDIKFLEKRLKKQDIIFILDHSDELSHKDIERLKKFDNCIIYPPIGFATREASLIKKEIFISNVENYLKEKLINKVN